MPRIFLPAATAENNALLMHRRPSQPQDHQHDRTPCSRAPEARFDDDGESTTDDEMESSPDLLNPPTRALSVLSTIAPTSVAATAASHQAGGVLSPARHRHPLVPQKPKSADDSHSKCITRGENDRKTTAEMPTTAEAITAASASIIAGCSRINAVDGQRVSDPSLKGGRTGTLAAVGEDRNKEAQQQEQQQEGRYARTASSSAPPLSRPPSPPPPLSASSSSTFSVVFVTQQLGLTLADAQEHGANEDNDDGDKITSKSFAAVVCQLDPSAVANPDGRLARSGLRVGDRVIAVGGVSTAGLDLEEVERRVIRGPRPLEICFRRCRGVVVGDRGGNDDGSGVLPTAAVTAAGQMDGNGDGVIPLPALPAREWKRPLGGLERVSHASLLDVISDLATQENYLTESESLLMHGVDDNEKEWRRPAAAAGVEREKSGATRTLAANEAESSGRLAEDMAAEEVVDENKEGSLKSAGGYAGELEIAGKKKANLCTSFSGVVSSQPRSPSPMHGERARGKHKGSIAIAVTGDDHCNVPSGGRVNEPLAPNQSHDDHALTTTESERRAEDERSSTVELRTFSAYPDAACPRYMTNNMKRVIPRQVHSMDEGKKTVVPSPQSLLPPPSKEPSGGTEWGAQSLTQTPNVATTSDERHPPMITSRPQIVTNGISSAGGASGDGASVGGLPTTTKRRRTVKGKKDKASRAKYGGHNSTSAATTVTATKTFATKQARTVAAAAVAPLTFAEASSILRKLGTKGISELALYKNLNFDELVQLCRYAGVDTSKRLSKVVMAERLNAVYAKTGALVDELRLCSSAAANCSRGTGADVEGSCGVGATTGGVVPPTAEVQQEMVRTPLSSTTVGSSRFPIRDTETTSSSSPAVAMSSPSGLQPPPPPLPPQLSTTAAPGPAAAAEFVAGAATGVQSSLFPSPSSQRRTLLSPTSPSSLHDDITSMSYNPTAGASCVDIPNRQTMSAVPPPPPSGSGGDTDSPLRVFQPAVSQEDTSVAIPPGATQMNMNPMRTLPQKWLQKQATPAADARKPTPNTTATTTATAIAVRRDVVRGGGDDDNNEDGGAEWSDWDFDKDAGGMAGTRPAAATAGAEEDKTSRHHRHHSNNSSRSNERSDDENNHTNRSFVDVADDDHEEDESSWWKTNRSSDDDWSACSSPLLGSTEFPSPPVRNQRWRRPQADGIRGDADGGGEVGDLRRLCRNPLLPPPAVAGARAASFFSSPSSSPSSSLEGGAGSLGKRDFSALLGYVLRRSSRTIGTQVQSSIYMCFHVVWALKQYVLETMKSTSESSTPDGDGTCK